MKSVARNMSLFAGLLAGFIALSPKHFAVAQNEVPFGSVPSANTGVPSSAVPSQPPAAQPQAQPPASLPPAGATAPQPPAFAPPAQQAPQTLPGTSIPGQQGQVPQVPNANTVVPLSPSPNGAQPTIGPDGYPVQPQPLAPGPGVTTQPAPVTPGDFTVPAPVQPVPVTQPSEVIDVKSNPEKKKTLAIVRTSAGNFTIRLARRQAPRTSQHFIDLARGDKEFIDSKTGRKVRRPFYNGLIFHRVVKNFIVQGGCPFGNGKGGPGFTVADEFSPSLRHRKAGMVSMANAGQPDTNGSQFFITLGPQPEFDDKYTVFGEVVQGMDVVRDIAHVKVGPTDRPIKRIYIISVDIIEE